MNHHEEHGEHEGKEFEEISGRVIGCAIEVHRLHIKLSGIRRGLILNFNVSRLKDGMKRYVL